MDSNLTRRRFLETSAAILGVSLVGCGAKESGGPVSRLNPDGTISLSGLETPVNGTARAFTFPDGEPGLIFVTAQGAHGAVSSKCTHAGCIVEWNAPHDPKIPLRCPCHESHFALDGKVLDGPANAPLAHYAVTMKGEEIQLRALSL
jgi:Rieske Fe-S protein